MRSPLLGDDEEAVADVCAPPLLPEETGAATAALPEVAVEMALIEAPAVDGAPLATAEADEASGAWSAPLIASFSTRVSAAAMGDARTRALQETAMRSMRSVVQSKVSVLKISYLIASKKRTK